MLEAELFTVCMTYIFAAIALAIRKRKVELEDSVIICLSQLNIKQLRAWHMAFLNQDVMKCRRKEKQGHQAGIKSFNSANHMSVWTLPSLDHLENPSLLVHTSQKLEIRLPGLLTHVALDLMI